MQVYIRYVKIVIMKVGEAMSVCCFTGHRTLEDPQALHRTLDDVLEQCVAQGYREFRCGGAIGFDTVAAQAVVRIRERYPTVRLVLILPCGDQDKYWSPQEKAVYQQLLTAADEVKVLSEHYYRGCMFARNRALVNGSQLCICYLTKPSGGTKMTVDYAKKQQLTILNLGDLI